MTDDKLWDGDIDSHLNVTQVATIAPRDSEERASSVHRLIESQGLSIEVAKTENKLLHLTVTVPTHHDTIVATGYPKDNALPLRTAYSMIEDICFALGLSLVHFDLNQIDHKYLILKVNENVWQYLIPNPDAPRDMKYLFNYEGSRAKSATLYAGTTTDKPENTCISFILCHGNSDERYRVTLHATAIRYGTYIVRAVLLIIPVHEYNLSEVNERLPRYKIELQVEQEQKP